MVFWPGWGDPRKPLREDASGGSMATGSDKEANEHSSWYHEWMQKSEVLVTCRCKFPWLYDYFNLGVSKTQCFCDHFGCEVGHRGRTLGHRRDNLRPN